MCSRCRDNEVPHDICVTLDAIFAREEQASAMAPKIECEWLVLRIEKWYVRAQVSGATKMANTIERLALEDRRRDEPILFYEVPHDLVPIVTVDEVVPPW